MVMIAIIVVIIVIIIVIIVVVIIIIIIVVVVIFVVLTLIYDIVFIIALHSSGLNLLLLHHSIGLETDFSNLDRSRVGESARICGRDRYTACHGHLVFILVNRTYCLSLCSLTLYLSL